MSFNNLVYGFSVRKLLSNMFNSVVMSSFLLEIITFVMVEGKHCVYMYESGYKYFQCSSFEYCCGPLCCRNRSTGFFQLWYFWLLIILMMMLCSGGGWWYKFRYRTYYGQTLQNVQATTTPFIYGTGPSMTPAQPVYPMPYHQPTMPPQPQQSQPQQCPLEAVPSDPPPPYCGPPPSYNVAVGGGDRGK